MNYQTRLDKIMEHYGIPISVLEEASNLLIIEKTLKAHSDYPVLIVDRIYYLYLYQNYEILDKVSVLEIHIRFLLKIY